MRRFWYGICALLLAGCIADEPNGTDVQVGDRIPAFKLEMNDGSSLTSEDLIGNPSLIILFHTSCADCRLTLPQVQLVYEKFGSQVRFVAISRAESAAEIRSWWKENGITLPFSAQEDRQVYELFASSRIPRIYIANSKGVVEYCYDDNPCPDYETLATALNDIR